MKAIRVRAVSQVGRITSFVHTVKVQYPQRLAVDLVQRSQRGQRQAVVSAEGDELWLRQQRRHSAPAAQLRERLGHLLHGHGIIDGDDGNIAAVDNLGPILVRVDIRPRVEAPETGLAGRGMADGTRSKPCACVDANIVSLEIADRLSYHVKGKLDSPGR